MSTEPASLALKPMDQSAQQRAAILVFKLVQGKSMDPIRGPRLSPGKELLKHLSSLHAEMDAVLARAAISFCSVISSTGVCVKRLTFHR